jgi:hypothetical protein
MTIEREEYGYARHLPGCRCGMATSAAATGFRL